MPLVARIGDVVQTRGEMFVEWKIKDFFSLSEKKDDYYDSPIFAFADSLWCLGLYSSGEKEDFSKDNDAQNGDSKEELATDNGRRDGDLSENWVELYLCREDLGPRKTIHYTFGIKCPDVVVRKSEKVSEFTEKYARWGGNFWKRDELRNRASKLVPGNVLTIACHLKCSMPSIARVSSSSRLWELSRNIRTVLYDGERSDFVLKLGDREWPVHKVILESRCEYFANMFRHDWVENSVGEVTFEDIEEEALDNVLNFVYTGCVEDMSVDNVCGIYVAAHKFLLDDLKALCVEFMKGDMCLEIVCKVLIIADTYGEEDLRQSAIEYFMLEDDRIFDSEEWKDLKKCHGSVAAEILEEITKRRKKRRVE